MNNSESGLSLCEWLLLLPGQDQIHWVSRVNLTKNGLLRFVPRSHLRRWAEFPVGGCCKLIHLDCCWNANKDYCDDFLDVCWNGWWEQLYEGNNYMKPVSFRRFHLTTTPLCNHHCFFNNYGLPDLSVRDPPNDGISCLTLCYVITGNLSCALLFDNYSVLQCSPPNSEGSQQFWSNITEIPSNPVIVHFGGLKTKLTGLPNNGEPHKGWPNLQHLDDCLNCIAHPQRSSRSKACTCWAAECSSSWHFTAREPDLRQ